MATYSISGTISPLSFVNTATTIVTWFVNENSYNNISPNSDGTYEISGLAPATYIIQVSGSNFLAAVASQTVVITDADVTGIDFEVAAAPNVGVFTPIFSDSFQRANENPLSDNGAWSPPNGSPGLITSTSCQILNNQALTLIENNADGAVAYVDIDPFPVLPANQFCQVTLATAQNGAVWLYLRSTLPGTGSTNDALDVNYNFFLGFGPGFSGWGIGAEDDDSGKVPYNWVPFQNWPVNVGDTWAVGIIGQGADGVLYVFQNGVCIWQASIAPNPDLDLMLANGTVATQLDASTPATTDIGVTHFVSGGFAITNMSGTSRPAPFAGYGTDISATGEVTTNPAGETNSARTSIFGTNRGSRFIG